MTCVCRQGEAEDDEAVELQRVRNAAVKKNWMFSTMLRLLNPRKSHGTHCRLHEAELARGRCGRAWKISPPKGFDTRTVQPVEESQYLPSYTGSLAPKYCCLLPAPSNRIWGTRWFDEALRYKPGGHGFDFRWSNLVFFY
jgi:hypothetical protein